MQIAGRFDIKRELGQGAMATVYLAVDQKYDRQVALKVLRPEVRWPGAAERFHREIQVAARLAHPNIVPLFDSGEADGATYFIMQYVEGAETLRERLTRDGALPFDEARRLARDVAAALDYAHRQGVVHRDIKPENILLAEGRALVLDFGIARALQGGRVARTTDAGLVIGTPAYMSPEQAGASEEVGPASDLYSLGCVLYEMLGGTPPFVGNTPQNVLVKHLQQVPRPLTALRPDTPAPLQALVARLLEKDPAERPTSAALLIDELVDTVSPRRSIGASWLVLAAGLATIAIVALLRPDKPTVRMSGPEEVAVLFLDAGHDSALTPLGTGLTNAVVDRLSRVEGLHVRSSDAVRDIERRGWPIDSVISQLRVGTVVTGEVRGTVDQPMISVRLLGSDGTQLDSRTIAAPGVAPMVLQDTLAEQVATFLRQRLGREISLRERQRGTSSKRAWFFLQRSDEARGQARTLLQLADTAGAFRLLLYADSLARSAQAEDPAWPEPRLQEGWLAVQRLELTRDSAQRALATAKGLQAATSSLALSPNLAEALELRGVIGAIGADAGGRRDSARLEQAIADLREGATSQNLHQARALSRLSRVLLGAGRFQEAKLAALQAWERDAFLDQADRVLLDLYQTSLYLQQFPEARRWCDAGRDRFPSNWLFTFCDLALQVMGADSAASPARAWAVVAALDTLAPASEHAPWRWEMMAASVLARAGLRDSARRTIDRARRAGAGDMGLDFYEAVARVQLGDTAEAITLLKEMVTRDPSEREQLAGDPAFKPLAGNSAFQALMR